MSLNLLRKTLILLAFFAAPIIAMAFPRWLLQWRYTQRILGPEEAPKTPVAIVFGAGLLRDGRPSPVLADRVATAAILYRQRKVQRLLMSGTGRADGYDEPAAMRDLAVALGVPASDVQIDRGGTRTFETCYRAREVFRIDRALLVSQRYHLPRALVSCRAVGIDANGVSADLRRYNPRSQGYWELREFPATLVALWEAYVKRSTIPRT